MLTDKTIGFIGAGNMAGALIKGILDAGLVSAGQILASDRDPARIAQIEEASKIKVFNRNYEVFKGADIVFLAIKPADMRDCLLHAAPDIDSGKIIISIAAGITTESILAWLKEGGALALPPVVRAMPNTPALCSEGMTGLAAGESAGSEELKLARALFEAVGKVIIVDEEGLLNAVTGLSGSGPAYVFLFMEALAEAGSELGIDKAQASRLALQTTLGAATLALASDKSLSELREMVTSPGGTTVEGLRALEEGDFRSAVAAAVKAATKRAEELSA